MSIKPEDLMEQKTKTGMKIGDLNAIMKQNAPFKANR